MAAPPEAAPQPMAPHPSIAAALQGQRRVSERAIIHLDMVWHSTNILASSSLSVMMT